MTWQQTRDVEQFVAAAGHLLDPVRDTVAWTQVENTRRGSAEPLFLWWSDSGAAVHTDGFPTLVCHADDAALTALLDVLPLEAVSGRTDLAVQLAHLLARRVGRSARLVRAERLHVLGELVAPSVDGRLREVQDEDLPLVEAWMADFLGTALTQGDPAAVVAQRRAGGGLWVWDVGGQAVSMVGANVPAAGAVRVGPVYTPPGLRGHGWAGALTAGVSALLRERGAQHVVLFTDLANPTSNALYARLGFVPVEDRAVLAVSPAG